MSRKRRQLRNRKGLKIATFVNGMQTPSLLDLAHHTGKLKHGQAKRQRNFTKRIKKQSTGPYRKKAAAKRLCKSGNNKDLSLKNDMLGMFF